MPPRLAVAGFVRHTVRLGPVLVAGHRVTLRDTRLADFAPWRAIRLRDREFIEPYWRTSLLSWDERHSRAWWIREYLRQRRPRAAHRALLLSVLVDGEFAGQCQLAPIDPHQRAAEMGLWMDSRRAGHGVGTVAGALITDYGFGPLGLHRITAPVCVGNYPARQAVIRGGMSHEATMIRALDVNGERRDHELWAVTANAAPAGGYVQALIASGVAAERLRAEAGSAGSRLAERLGAVTAAAPLAVIAVAARYYLGAPLRAGGALGTPRLPSALSARVADGSAQLGIDTGDSHIRQLIQRLVGRYRTCGQRSRDPRIRHADSHSDAGGSPLEQSVTLRKHRARWGFRRDRRVPYTVCAAGRPIGGLTLDLSVPNPALTLDFDSDVPPQAAAAAVTLLLDYAIDQLHAERLETMIDPVATHLTAIATASGLHCEGVLSGARIGPDGDFADVEMWAITDEKWSRTSASG